MELVSRAALLFVIASSVTASADTEAPSVKSSLGTIQGRVYTVEDVQVDGFLGIPYAKPPVGDLRFALPVAYGEVGELKATNYSAACAQPKIYFEPPNPNSEDCLHLNVFRKSGTKEGDDKPVIVIFHGGAFSSGTSSDYLYYSPPLAGLGDVVVVHFNYRLGILGFADMKELAPGNLGLHDQRLVLEWIQDNIRAFGGNPDRVTLLGTSAGSMSVSAQVETPLNNEGRKLFHAAIMDGGVLTAGIIQDPDESESRVKKIAAKVNCTTDGAEMLECLRKADVNDLVANSFDAECSPLWTFRPTSDGKFISKELAHGDHSSANSTEVKVLMGYAKDEGTWFAGYNVDLTGNNFPNISTEKQFTDWCEKLASGYKLSIDLKVDDVAKKVAQTYYQKHETRFLDASAFVGDGLFKCPINGFVRNHAKSTQNLYVFAFNRKLHQKYPDMDPNVMGAFHFSPFLHMSGALIGAKDLVQDAPAVDAEDKAFFLDAIRMVADFAKTDDTPKFRDVSLPNFTKGEGIIVFDEKPEVAKSLYSEEQCKNIFPSYEPKA